jgi:hypothetical protein
MPDENHRRAKGANCRYDKPAMSGYPVHAAILGAALPGANAKMFAIRYLHVIPRQAKRAEGRRKLQAPEKLQ